MPTVEVREARYFVAVAEELHFGRAAARLRMSQPPLSQAVRALERRLGTLLLHRTTREVSLTPAGAEFLHGCRALVAASDAAAAAARAAAGGGAGRLRVGAVTSAFHDPLPDVLARFAAVHPAVRVDVQELDTRDAVEAVRRRELDVALVRSLAVPADCERAVLRTERFVLAVPAAWPDPPADLAQAAGASWIWLPRSISPDYHDQVVACCRAAGFAPDARHTARSTTSQLAMVGCGLGVALVPRSVAEQAAPAGRVAFRETPGTATIDLSAVWRRGGTALVDGFTACAGAPAAAATAAPSAGSPRTPRRSTP